MGMISTAGAWGWNPHKCPQCGEIYNLTCEPSAWGYAYGGRLVCSYHCMRAMDRKFRERVNMKGKPQPERDREIWQMHKDGLQNEDIVYKTGLSRSNVQRILKKEREREAAEQAAEKEEDRAMEEEPRIEEEGKEKTKMRHADDRDTRIRQLESEKDMMQKTVQALMDKNTELREQAKRDYREAARLKRIIKAAWGMKEAWQERCALMDSMERNQARINGYQDELDELAKEGGLTNALRNEEDGPAADG